ncbi:MAG: hypothetical protein ACXWUZ_17465 [Allosphingosinicella sp.]
MRSLLLTLPLLLAGGCETYPEPYNPIGTVHYSAMGQDPFWLVTIGDDRIVLRLAGEAGAQQPSEAVWPRTLPRTVDGTTIWESGEGTQVIAIASRRGPCTDARGLAYADEVRVRLSGRELRGCGGPLLRREDG